MGRKSRFYSTNMFVWATDPTHKDKTGAWAFAIYQQPLIDGWYWVSGLSFEKSKPHSRFEITLLYPHINLPS